jgi:hypothetical protein
LFEKIAKAADTERRQSRIVKARGAVPIIGANRNCA